MREKLSPAVSCPPMLRPAVLRLLHDRLPCEQQAGLAQTLHGIGVCDESAWDGLLATFADGTEDICGVAWVQLLAGGTACLWIPPEQADNRSLLRAAAAFLDGRNIPLAQLVVDEGDGYAAELLEEAGFPKFAELLYLYADLSKPMPLGPVTKVERQAQQTDEPAFVGHAGDDQERFGRLLERTYIGTLDCPGLDGVRPLRQVLEGYRSQGAHRPEHWYALRHDDQDVGALILAEHRGLGNWELIYMGLVPEVRGRGWGTRIVRFALEVAASEGAERLVLAVDANNLPALEVYRRLGFVDWARRIVYARLQSRA